ncbi:MAG: hypothetical protein QOH84_43 [Kribbellaceae bacterium]|nr:hypothetical protein [Kribbellaceae bacterium]
MIPSPSSVRLPVLYFVRSRWSLRTGVILLALLALSYCLQGQSIGVPFVPGDAVVRSSPLLPVILTIPLAGASATAMATLESIVASPRLTAARLFWAFALTAVAVGLAAAAASGAEEAGTVATAARNAMAFLGAGLLGAALLGADLAWLPSCLLALCTFFFGKNIDNEVRGWAWLLHPAADSAATVISIGLLVSGGGLFALLDSTGWLRRKAAIG